MAHERPPTAPLFDAALHTSQHAYGSKAHPQTVHIITHAGLEIWLEVPPDWEYDADLPPIKFSDCFAETLATIVQAGKRLTKAALLIEMEKLGRKRAESMVSVALADLQKLGIIDNRQDTSPNGFGLKSWE